jgi:hypothetical protein
VHSDVRLRSKDGNPNRAKRTFYSIMQWEDMQSCLLLEKFTPMESGIIKKKKQQRGAKNCQTVQIHYTHAKQKLTVP